MLGAVVPGEGPGESESCSAAIAGWGDVGVEGISCNGGQKVILLNTQSINGLCRVSQLYPRTIKQEESNGVT